MERYARIHVTYIIGILLFIIAALATVKWHGIPDLVGYLSFALTLTSLILAILATAYAIYANTSLGAVLARLTSSSESLTSTASHLAGATTELAGKVGSIPNSLEGPSHTVQATHLLLKDVAEKGLALPMADVESKGLKADTKPEPGLSLSAKALRSPPVYGLGAILIAVRAAQRKTGFQLSRLIEPQG